MADQSKRCDDALVALETTRRKRGTRAMAEGVYRCTFCVNAGNTKNGSPLGCDKCGHRGWFRTIEQRNAAIQKDRMARLEREFVKEQPHAG